MRRRASRAARRVCIGLRSSGKNLLDAAAVLANTLFPLLKARWVVVMDKKGETQKRRHPRAVPLRRLAVAWQSGARQGVSYLESVALGGLFLLTRQPLPMRSAVKILVELPFGEVRARGVVRRVNPSRGMGIEFISMTPEDRARLIRALQPMLAAQPA